MVTEPSGLEGRAASLKGGSLWPSFAAVFAGVAASLCCILPVLAAVGGIGSAALAARFEPYRPWLLGLTAVVLGFGYYDGFFRSRPVVCEDGTCRLPVRVTVQRVILLVATVLAAAAVTFQWWIAYVLG